jgi:hypothetical protein
MPIELPQPETRAPAGSFDMPVASDSPTSFSTPRTPVEQRPQPPENKPHRPWVILFAVLTAALVGFLAIVVLYHRTSREETYSNTVVVWGRDDSWNGAKVTVTGSNLPEGGFEGELTTANHLACRFHVPAGNFAVVVQKDGRTLDRAITNPPLTAHTIWWPCRAPPSATRPSLK